MQRPGARILYVGAGVGVVSTQLCRLFWPQAEAVGPCIAPHASSAAPGVAAAGLKHWIESATSRSQTSGELDADDLAFVPQPFLPAGSLLAGLPRIRVALRPGGWWSMPTSELPEDQPMVAAARRFRARIWVAGLIGWEELEECSSGRPVSAGCTRAPDRVVPAITARRAPAGEPPESRVARIARRRRPGAGILRA